MPYEYLEEGVTADVTFHAWGESLDELFAAAADATVRVMVASLDTIRPALNKSVLVAADALDLLLLRFLDELIFLKDAESVLLRATEVHVQAADHGQQVRARFCGEAIDPARHELVADVKAVTLYGLRVEHLGSLWHADVTLDV
ncbi:MAG: archease [Deltaproteobacteria bacterium]|nr:archease [Deltaproteobacteria bacterium]